MQPNLYYFLSLWSGLFHSNSYLSKCNHGHNILRIFDVLPNFPFTTSKTKPMIVSNKESQVSAMKMVGYLFLRQYKNTKYVNHCSDTNTPAHPAGRTHHKDKSITPLNRCSPGKSTNPPKQPPERDPNTDAFPRIPPNNHKTPVSSRPCIGSPIKFGSFINRLLKGNN